MRVPKFRSILSLLVLASSMTNGKPLSPPWPTDDPEVACIINNLDWSDSVVAQTMMRGHPIFGEHGLNISNGSGAPTNTSAYLNLEPTFELDVENYIALLESDECRLHPYRIFRAYYRPGDGAGWRVTYRSYIGPGVDIGLTHLQELLAGTYAVRTSFDLMYGSDTDTSFSTSTYHRDATRFAEEYGTSYSYRKRQRTGPLILRNPCAYQNETIIRFTQDYLDAIDELPSDFNYQAYLEFGTRFGRGYVQDVDFSFTDIFIAGQEYVTLGSTNYTETNCQDPPFSRLRYGLFTTSVMFPSCTANTLTDDQRSKLKTLENNLAGMILQNTKAPTTSPTQNPITPTTRAPSFSPSLSPTRSPIIVTSGAATKTCSTFKLPVALALVFFPFLFSSS